MIFSGTEKMKNLEKLEEWKFEDFCYILWEIKFWQI